MIYFCVATKGIRPKISFTLVLLVHVPYPNFPQLSVSKSFGYLIFPFFAIIKLEKKLHKSKSMCFDGTVKSIINMKNMEFFDVQPHDAKLKACKCCFTS